MSSIISSKLFRFCSGKKILRAFLVMFGVFLLSFQNLYSTTFYSKLPGTGIVNTPTNWNTVADGSGLDAVAGDFAVAGNLFIIQSTHSYTTNAAWNVAAAIQIDGTFTLGNHSCSWTGAVTVNGTCTTSSNNDVISGITTLTINNGGAVTLANNNCTFSCTNLTMSGTSTITGGNANRTVTVTGALTVSLGATALVTGAITFSVGTTSAINGGFSIATNGGIKTFTGKVTLGAAGTWTSTGVTTAANLVFAGGIKNDNATASSFQASGCTFNASQDIEGIGPIALSTANADGVVINSNFIITNKNTNSANGGVLIEGLLQTGGTGSWVQAASSYLSLGNNANPITAVSCDFTTNDNTVNYSRAGNQTGVLNRSYRNLVFSGSGVKTLTQAGSGKTVSGTLTVSGSATATIDGAFTFTVTGTTTVNSGCTLNGAANYSLGAMTLAGTYAPTGASNAVGAVTYSGTLGSIAGGGTLTAASITLTAATGAIGSSVLTVTGTTTIDNTSTLNVSNTATVKTFNGLIDIQGNGVLSSTEATTASFVVKAGIDNDGTLSVTTATFSTTNPSLLSGSGTYAFSANVTISGAITVTNQCSNVLGINIDGVLDGTAGGSTWKNDPNTKLFYGNVTQPMNTGALDVSANGNLVSYDRGNDQTLKIPLTSYYHLTADVAGTKTLTQIAGVGVLGNLNVSTAATLTVNGAFTFGVTGTTTIASGCTLNGAAHYSLGAVTLSGNYRPTSATNSTGAITYNGGAGIIAGGGTITAASLNLLNSSGSIGNTTITVSTTTTIGTTYTLTCSSDNGVKTFVGNIDVQGTGTFDATAITSAGRLDIRGGISNTGTFTCTVIKFSTNTQNLSGSGTYSFAGAAVISGAITVRNQCTNVAGIVFSSSLDGDNASSTWEQDDLSVVKFTGTTRPFATLGVLDAYTGGETNIVHYNGAGNNVYGGANEYYNLTFDGSGTATLASASTVRGTLSLLSATLDNTSTLTMASGTAIIRSSNGALTTNAPTFSGTVDITYTTGTLTTGKEMPVAATVLNNLTINVAGATVTLDKAVTCIGTCALTSGNIDLSTFDFTLGVSASVTGVFDNTHMLVCSSTGKLIRKGDAAADFIMTYPVGTAFPTVVYTPMVISAFAGTLAGGAQITVLPVAGAHPLTIAPVPYNAIQKYWTVSTTDLSAVSATVTFEYKDIEICPSCVEGNFAVRSIYSSAFNAVTVPSLNNGANTFTSTGATTTDLNGSWIVIDPTPAVPRSWYSYQSGDWANPLTWTLTVGVYDNPSSLIPGQASTADDITIRASHDVFTLVDRVVAATVLQGNGSLDVRTTTACNLGTVSGTGTLRINSYTIPLGTYTTFVAAGGGTFEYYDVASGNLPTQATYCNLLLSNSTAGNLIYTLTNPANPTTYTLNGTLTTSNTGAGTLTFTLGNVITNAINLNIAGIVTNGVGCTINCASVNAIHTVTCSSDLINNGTFDLANNLAFSSAATGAGHLVFTGLSNNSFTCNGTTEVYSLHINKGTDQTWGVNLTAPTGTFAYTTDFTDATGVDGIAITNGTLTLGAGISLTQLSNANGYALSYAGNNNACLKIDGATINTGNKQINLDGKFWMVSGTVTIGRNGMNMRNNSEFYMEGGTLTVERLLNGGAGTTVATFTMTGGTINIDNTPTGTGVTDLPRFSLAGTSVTFNISGGTINIKNPVNDTRIANGGLALQSAIGNYAVTGGTWNIYVPALSTGTDNFDITSTVPFYDLNIYSEGAGTCVARLNGIGGDAISAANALTVLHDFTIGSGADAPTFDANGNNVTVGGNFTIAAGASYKGNSNTTTFNGPQTYGRTNQTLTANTTITRAGDLVVNKASGILDIANGAFDCLESLTLTSGALADGGQTIDVAGNITNSGTHTGAGAIRVQRGVRSTSGVPALTYDMPSIQLVGYGAGTSINANITIKNGIVTSLTYVSGGSGYTASAAIRSLTIAGGNGANFTAGVEINGAGQVTSTWVMNGGSGYGPTATEAGGALYEAVITGTTNSAPGLGTGTLTAVNVLATGEGYVADATVNISASGTTGASTCVGETDTAPTIGGSGSGTFTNLSINNDVTGGGAVFTANQTVNGDLRLLNGILNIATYNLALSSTTNIYSDGAAGTTFTNTKMIKSSGNSSDGGITKTYSTTSFTFPFGTGTIYTPGTIAFTGAPTVYGSITTRPVALEHPLVSVTGQALTYYWKTTSSGFTLGAATVTHTYTYDQSDVIDNGGTILESAYVPGRFDISTVSWTTNANMAKVDEATNVVTFDGATFNGTIDGDYTAGDQTPSDPFNTVLTFYSLNGGPYDWNNPASWSNVSHTGAVAVSVPSANSIVRIGDGGTNNHTMVVDANGAVAGSVLIAVSSTLDLGTTTGHNFGTYVIPAAGNGTLKISSADALADFPAGDFSLFLGLTGGTVEYYSTGAQDFAIPATSDAPSSTSLVNYYNLTLTPATGRYIQMPDLNQTIHNTMTVQGASATGIVRLNTASARTLAITNDLMVTTGNLQFRNGFAQAITVGDDITVGTGAIFNIENAGALLNTMSIAGTLTVNGTGNFDMCNWATGPVLTGSCAVTFTGATNESITGTAGGIIEFHTLIMNKGIDQTYVLNVDYAGTFTPPTEYEWLTLTNGTFRWNKAATLTISNITSPTNFTIPSTACLSLGATGTGINVVRYTSGAPDNDIILGGKIEVLAGTFNVGNSAKNSHNDIEIDQTGAPTIDVQGAGQLFVNGAIRRGTTTASGALVYSQSGTSVVTIAGRTNNNLTRGKLEICNTGSSFNMAGTSILELRCGDGTDGTFGDLYIAPTGASAVASGTLIRFVTVIAPADDEVFGINSSIPLANITVDGEDATNEAELKLLVNGLTLTGNLIISNVYSVFNANAFAVNIAGNLTNSNTTATVGTAVGGYRPGASAQITTFNSTTANQTITGVGANITNFANLLINNSFGTVSFAANTATTVNTDLTLSSAMADGGNIITVLGNNTINAAHTGAGKIYLAGTAAQTITGSGSFTNLDLNNTSGTDVTLLSNMTINGTLTLTNDQFFIDDFLLSLGASATAVANANASRFIKMNGSISDLGVSKYYSNGAGTSITYTFPIGVGTNYRPASFTGTATTASAYLNIKQINGAHPSTQDVSSTELLTYWAVDESGMSVISVTHNYTYMDADVQGIEGSYVTGRFDQSIPDWSPAGGGEASTSVTTGTNLLAWTTKTYLDGDYTAGYTSEFAALATYYSGSNVVGFSTGGVWSNVNSWSTVGHGGAPAVSPPNGNKIYIATGHTITVDGNSKRAQSIDLAGTGTMDCAATIGHIFGSFSGTGTLKVASGSGSFILPTATYTTFVASGGGTIEYNGAVSGNLSATQLTYNNLVFDGASTKTLPAAALTVNGNFTIANTASNVVNHPSNTVTLYGNWVNNRGTTGYTSAAGTIKMFNTTAVRTMSGATTFNNLTFDNTFATIPQITISSDIIIKSTLNMTAGVISNVGYTVTLGQSGVASTLTRAASSTTNWFVGTFKRFWLNSTAITSASGNYYGLFPLGASAASSYCPVQINTTVSPTTGGSATAVFFAASGAIDLSPFYNDGGVNIERVHKSSFQTSTSGVVGGTYNISATMNNLSAGTLTDIRLAIFTGGTTASATGTHAAATGTAVNPTATRTAVALAGLTNDFRIATRNVGATPLPIELLDFTAKPDVDKVNLNWSTATEINNDYFTVEKSIDGINFESIDVVDAAGNSTSRLNYASIDNNPYTGVSYYRLKQTDFDGAYSYSNVVAVEYSKNIQNNLIVYPNPNNGENFNILMFSEKNKEILVVVTDVSGRVAYSKVIITQTDGENVYAVDNSNKLAPGIYIVTATSKQEIVSKRLIVK